MTSSSLGIFPIDGVKVDSFTIYVDGDNVQGPWVEAYEHPFRHIQDGIDAVTEGETAYVHNGLYYENLFISFRAEIGYDGSVVPGEAKSFTTSDC